MGTTSPLVCIEAATIAGGAKNQDRYAYGDGWAFVLDGASSLDSPLSGHDGGWYAERLKNALTERLRDTRPYSTVDLIADAITEAASAHDPEDGACPTSTIALARWSADQLDLYLLGDSYAIVTTGDGSTLATDDRLSSVATDMRKHYRQRLADGHGFDATHRALLREVQKQEARVRNRSDGYWIAGDRPDAALHALHQSLPLDRVDAVLLATDGVFTTDECIWHPTHRTSPLQMITAAQRLETEDIRATRYPRSKSHDDKTIVQVTFLR